MKKKYEVYASVVIWVEAKDEDEAADIALDKISKEALGDEAEVEIQEVTDMAADGKDEWE